MPRPAILMSLVASLMLSAAPQVLAQTATPERREVGSLVYDGIPEIPTSLRPQIQRFRNARSASFQDWMPDGSILIATRFGETAQIHRVAAPGAARTQLTFFDEPIAGATAIPGSARYAYTRDSGGAEYFQTYLADLKGAQIAITEPGTRNDPPVFSADGKTAVWSQVRAGEPNYDIVAVEVADPTARRTIYKGTGAWSPLAISPDGTKVLIGKYNSVEDSQLWLLDVATGEATRIHETADPVSFGGGEFTADGRSIITTSDEGSDFSRLVEIDLATNVVTPLTETAAWDVENFDLSDDGRLLAYAVNEDGFSKVHIRDLRTRRALPQPDLPVGVLGALKFSPDGSKLAINLATPQSSGDVWSWDVVAGGLTRWTTSEVGPVDPTTFVVPDLVRFTSFDGLNIPAFVYRAKGEGRHPVMIDIHGGPEGQSRPGFNTTYQQWIADLGATVIVPNVRGSTGYGKAWVGLDNGPLRQNSVKDIGALLDWIATQPDLDPEKVVVHGGSYGGFMVLASLAAYSDRLAGAVDIVGISNFISFLENTEGYRRDLRRVEYGDERDPAMRAVFEQISPLNLTDGMTSPLLVIQGANDPRVPRTEAEQIVSAVRAEGQPVWYLLAMDEGHGFRKKRNVDSQAEVTNLFLRRVFDLPLPAPASPATAQ
jgi:dipeptidyl aminopeptidase/acylaminoacyl peptidase